jgi:hypothetical protein
MSGLFGNYVGTLGAEQVTMKKRCGEEQIIGCLHEADPGLATKALCRKHGFSEASYCVWEVKFAGMNARKRSGSSR